MGEINTDSEKHEAKKGAKKKAEEGGREDQNAAVEMWNEG